MRSLTVVVLVAVALCATACTTVTVPTHGFSVQGTVTNTEDKTVPGRTVREEAYNLTPEAARHREKMAKIKAKTERVKAKAAADAANPCSSWFLAPSYCYGYPVGYYGGYGASTVNRYGYGGNW